jgi:two-component system OmpR family sensor kinase
VSLRLRLALWWGGLTGLLVLAVGLLGYTAQALTLYGEVDRELLAHAVQTAGVLAAAPAGEAAVLWSVDPTDPAVRLYRRDGTVLAQSPRAPLAPAVDPGAVFARPAGPVYDPLVALPPTYGNVEAGAGAFGLAKEPDGTRWRAYVLPASGGEPVAYVVALSPLDRTDAAMATLRWLVPALAAASAALVLAASELLAGRLLRPVAVLTDTAAAIARARELGRRVPAPVGHRRDELGHMAATFNGMLDSLEEAHRAQQRFVADASHELRAPLTVILANLELLERQTTLTPEERREAVREAARETRRLVRLVADLLALARADAGTPLRRRPVELDRVLMDGFGRVRHLADGKRVTTATLEPALVEGDPEQLRQLLLALIENAVKYTPPGGRITLGLCRRGGAAEVTVRDTGIGIGPEDLPHVFERFYRAAPARRGDPGGTGLGLAIAREIAEQHGGTVSLASRPGRGTTATVRLPLVPPVPQSHEPAGTDQLPHLPSGPSTWQTPAAPAGGGAAFPRVDPGRSPGTPAMPAPRQPSDFGSPAGTPPRRATRRRHRP